MPGSNFWGANLREIVKGELRRIPLKRTSENAQKAKFAEFTFRALRCILLPATSFDSARGSMPKKKVNNSAKFQCFDNDHIFWKQVPHWVHYSDDDPTQSGPASMINIPEVRCWCGSLAKEA
jgi:hypothetical protein